VEWKLLESLRSRSDGSAARALLQLVARTVTPKPLFLIETFEIDLLLYILQSGLKRKLLLFLTLICLERWYSLAFELSKKFLLLLLQLFSSQFISLQSSFLLQVLIENVLTPFWHAFFRGLLIFIWILFCLKVGPELWHFLLDWKCLQVVIYEYHFILRSLRVMKLGVTMSVRFLLIQYINIRCPVKIVLDPPSILWLRSETLRLLNRMYIWSLNLSFFV
jgi:hypothetical protein